MPHTRTSEAEKLVSEFYTELPDRVTAEAKETAKDYARTTELETPVNRAPSSIAAGALYLAANLRNERVTHEQVSAASGVSKGAIRKARYDMVEQDEIRW